MVIELCENMRPSYLLFNKLNTDFDIGEDMFDYTRKVVFGSFKKIGIRKLLMVTKSDQYEDRYKYIENKNPFMKGFNDMESAIFWVKNQVR